MALDASPFGADRLAFAGWRSPQAPVHKEGCYRRLAISLVTASRVTPSKARHSVRSVEPTSTMKEPSGEQCASVSSKLTPGWAAAWRIHSGSAAGLTAPSRLSDSRVRCQAPSLNRQARAIPSGFNWAEDRQARHRVRRWEARQMALKNGTRRDLQGRSLESRTESRDYLRLAKRNGLTTDFVKTLRKTSKQGWRREWESGKPFSVNPMNTGVSRVSF